VIKRLAAVAAALGLTLMFAGTALATTEPLHQTTPIAWNDASVSQECDAGQTAAPGTVIWHFVAHTTTNDFTMTASFSDGTTVTNLPPDKIVDTYELHWDVTTSTTDGTGPTQLLSASITGTGTVDAGGFNLSHVCANPPTPVPEAPASALLLLSAGMIGAGFVAWRMRQARTAA
jgi:hypothetical protein